MNFDKNSKFSDFMKSVHLIYVQSLSTVIGSHLIFSIHIHTQNKQKIPSFVFLCVLVLRNNAFMAYDVESFAIIICLPW